VRRSVRTRRKPGTGRAGGGEAGVLVFGQRAAHLARWGALPPADPAAPAVVQRFVAGREHSTCSIARDGRVVATMVYRGAVMSGSVAVAFERVDVPAIDAWTERFVMATGWSGFISFDFIIDAAGVPHAIECNPRATSGVHFWEGEDIAKAILEGGWQGPVRVRPYRTLQQFYACLTETQGAMLRRKGFLPALRSLVTTRDVSWDWRDPWPFLSMIGTSCRSSGNRSSRARGLAKWRRRMSAGTKTDAIFGS